MTDKLSHFDDAGQAHMVDVSAKAETRREAVASAFVELNDAVLAALPKNPKGNPLEVARFAGIQAAKKTSELIPMCHPLAAELCGCSQAEVVAGGVAIRATAATVAGTGVEMEAMTAAAIAALTVYDMTKALDKSIRIREVVLLSRRAVARAATTNARAKQDKRARRRSGAPHPQTTAVSCNPNHEAARAGRAR